MKFKELKESGLEAKNPDQSCSMERSFSELVKVCRWKGFSESDIDILFKTAKESSKIETQSVNYPHLKEGACEVTCKGN
jgi:hypothetical protein